VIIPTRDRAQLLARQLEAFTAQTFTGSWELIVADNGSRDGTGDVVEEFSARLPARLVAAAERRGAAFARNRGAAAAVGDYLLFVDDDDRVTPGWLAAMAHATERADILRGRDRYLYSGSDAGDAVVGELDELPSPFGFLPSISTANCGIRTELFWRVGGFNEEYARLEDTDLFWRAQLADGRPSFVPDAILESSLRHGMRAVWSQTYHDSVFVPMLYRDFRRVGMPRSRTRDAGQGWARVARYGPRWSTSHHGREELAREVAWRVGMMVGSVRYRVWFL